MHVRGMHDNTPAAWGIPHVTGKPCLPAALRVKYVILHVDWAHFK